MQVDANADRVIDSLDAGTLVPYYHPVVRAIIDHVDLDPDDRDLLAALDHGDNLDTKALCKRLWSRIKALPVDREGVPRLLNILVRPDQQMDWFGAEMVIFWARNEGLSEQQILEAFGLKVPFDRNSSI